jgi:hypothetical protein
MLGWQASDRQQDHRADRRDFEARYKPSQPAVASSKA